MAEGFTPSAPPMERPKRGPKPGSKRTPKNGASGEVTSVIDTLDIFFTMAGQLDALPVKHRRAIMKALVERFPA